MEKIGYMGIPGSFSEIAAKELVRQCGIEESELVPLVSAANILVELKTGAVKWGVLAIENSTAGPVSEFVNAFKGVEYETEAKYILPIHHCLFKKSKDIALETLTTVASHPQALKQTEGTRQKYYSFMKEQVIEDTAIGAEWLASGQLPECTAVICSKGAGEAWGLDLIQQNIEDSNENKTTFLLIRLKKKKN